MYIEQQYIFFLAGWCLKVSFQRDLFYLGFEYTPVNERTLAYPSIPAPFRREKNITNWRQMNVDFSWQWCII